jgi:uncharacterized protein YecE (DUF72 family)
MKTRHDTLRSLNEIDRLKSIETSVDGAPEAIRIGCAGWAIAKYNSSLFPTNGTHLERYARVFSCCEINSSFYRQHRPETWGRWAASVPAAFQFSVKAPKTITHGMQLGCEQAALRQFLSQLAPLGGKLGPVLFQLPARQRFEVERLRTFLSQIREIYQGDVVFEPRNPAWFESTANELFADFSVARAAVDPACVPSGRVPAGWKGLAYFRLHGSPRMYYSTYDEPFLTAIADKIRLSGTPRTWCVFDNTASGAAPRNALELMLRAEQVPFRSRTGTHHS